MSDGEYRPNLTESVIRRRVRETLYRVSGGLRKNQCDSVSAEFAYQLETEGFDSYLARAPFSFGNRDHYVALISADETEFTSDLGYVIVDATVKQFEDDVGIELPEVAVIPPDDSRHSEWYNSINIIG